MLYYLLENGVSEEKLFFLVRYIFGLFVEVLDFYVKRLLNRFY